MRRTTQWAVFTSMNQQQPARRSTYEPTDRTSAGVVTEPETAPDMADPRSAPDTRRDRIELM